MARVGVDIDGVLYPFDDEFRDALVRGGWRTREQCPPATKWKFYEDWKMTLECFIDYCDQFTDDGNLFRYGQPYEGAVDAMWRLREAGHTIVLITNRNFGSEGKIEAATRHWLDHWAIPYDELHFVEDKREIDVDYHIDDNADNFRAMLDKGVESWLLRRPHNAHEWVLRTVRSLSQYVSFVIDRESPCQTDEPIVHHVCKRPEGSIENNQYHYGIELLGGDKPELEYVEPTQSTQKGASGEVRVTSSTGGQKGSKLARFDLIPAEALWQVAELYGKGAEKYDDHNWRKGYSWSLSIAALMRHLSLFLQGQDYDEETGCHHLTAVVFHSMTLITFGKEHPEFDDRFKPDA